MNNFKAFHRSLVVYGGLPKTFLRAAISIGLANGLAQSINVCSTFMMLRLVETNVIGQYVLFTATIAVVNFGGSYSALCSREFALGSDDNSASSISRRTSLVALIRTLSLFQAVIFVIIHRISLSVNQSDSLFGWLVTAFGAGSVIAEAMASTRSGILTARGGLDTMLRSLLIKAIAFFILSVLLGPLYGLVGLAGALFLSHTSHLMMLYCATPNRDHFCKPGVKPTAVDVKSCLKAFRFVLPSLLSTVGNGLCVSACFGLIRSSSGGFELLAVLGAFERYRIALMYFPHAIATYAIPKLAAANRTSFSSSDQQWFDQTLKISVIVCVVVVAMLAVFSDYIMILHGLSPGRWRIVFMAIVATAPFLVANILLGSRLLAEGRVALRSVIDLGSHVGMLACTAILLRMVPDVAYQLAQSVCFAAAVFVMWIFLGPGSGRFGLSESSRMSNSGRLI